MPEEADTHPVLAAYDAMETHRALDGQGLQLWFEFELLALEHGLDPDPGDRAALEARLEGRFAKTDEDGAEEAPAAA